MKKLLMIAYDFPPAIAGVRRTLKFIKYLPEHGWEPVVLTVRPVRSAGYDEGPLEELKERGVRVYRSGSLDPYRVHYVLGRALRGKGKKAGDGGGAGSMGKGVARWLRRWLFVPDDRMLWVPFGFWEALDVIKREGIKHIYTTSYPNSAHVIGLLLKVFRGVKWVADFRDGWVQNPTFYEPATALHGWASSVLERAVARRADVVVSVSEPITEHLRRVASAGGGGEKFVTITNGFDEEDYAGTERGEGEGGKFRLLYAGTFFGKRSPEALLRGLAGALEERAELREEMECVLMSALEERYERLIRELGLEGVVKVSGFKGHRETLEAQVNADVLVVVIPDVRNAEIMVTQKVFEYLGARRPILAIVPEGECRRIVTEAGAGVVVEPGDVEGIKRAVLEYYDKYKAGTLAETDAEKVRKYTRRELTRRLAEAMAGLGEESEEGKR
jgi:glycosyltransferase involved in cell wall biosynthesis